MSEDINQLKQQLKHFQQLQKEWQIQKEYYIKNIGLLKEELNQVKTINASLLKNTKHKRTSSEEHTFIFNQTNISSYYPTILLPTSNWLTKSHLRGHLDSVRALHWQSNHLLSGGEDSLLKVWDKDQLHVTIRQHLGPIYTIVANNQYIFSAGAEGVIRRWGIQGLMSGKSPDKQGEFHQDSIWELSLNQSGKMLASSSADGQCKIFNSSTLKGSRTIKFKNDSPTSIDWLNEQNLIIGYVNAHKISILEAETGSISWQYSFKGSQKSSQPNKIICSERHKIIVGAHQDRTLRFYDPNSNKIIKSLVGHSDSITSVCFRYQGHELVSCGHDGSMRIWDLRKYRCVQDISVHMKKYDQSALSLAHKRDEHLVAIGGADGLIKIFTPNLE